MSNMPPISNKHKICVICEGFEDFEYFDRLTKLAVWNPIYEFCPINAKSASNIFARYQDAFSNNSYELVLVFCDTDKYPYQEYIKIKEKINRFHDKEGAADHLIIFANPCIMQIVLLHFGETSLKNQGKKTNGEAICNLTGVADYDAHLDQIREICNKIYRRSYAKMKERISKINIGDTVSGSTNFIDYLERFENDDSEWIKEINAYIQDDTPSD